MRRLVPRGGGVVTADGPTTANGMDICCGGGCVELCGHTAHSSVPRDTFSIWETRSWALAFACLASSARELVDRAGVLVIGAGKRVTGRPAEVRG